MVVDLTGGGKSLILSMTAISVGEITLLVIPLLALTANQLARLNNAIQKYGAITAVHLDEMLGDDLRYPNFSPNSTLSLIRVLIDNATSLLTAISGQ